MTQKITNKFQRIADKYGEIIFRCAMQHAFETGAQQLTARRLNAAKRSIQKKEEEMLATGKISMMPANFQIEILECEFEIVQENDFWELMRFVKKNLFIGK